MSHAASNQGSIRADQLRGTARQDTRSAKDEGPTANSKPTPRKAQYTLQDDAKDPSKGARALLSYNCSAIPKTYS